MLINGKDWSPAFLEHHTHYAKFDNAEDAMAAYMRIIKEPIDGSGKKWRAKEPRFDYVSTRRWIVPMTIHPQIPLLYPGESRPIRHASLKAVVAMEKKAAAEGKAIKSRARNFYIPKPDKCARQRWTSNGKSRVRA